MNGKYKKGYEWMVQDAVRNKERARAKQGMVLGVKEGLELVRQENSGENGCIEKEVKLGKETVVGSRGLYKWEFR